MISVKRCKQWEHTHTYINIHVLMCQNTWIPVCRDLNCVRKSLKIQCVWNSDLYHCVLFSYWNNSEPVCFKGVAVLHGSSTIQYGNASLPCRSPCYCWLIQGTHTTIVSDIAASSNSGHFGTVMLKY